MAPFDPVGLAEIKNKIGGPVSAVQSDKVELNAGGGSDDLRRGKIRRCIA